MSTILTEAASINQSSVLNDLRITRRTYIRSVDRNKATAVSVPTMAKMCEALLSSTSPGAGVIGGGADIAVGFSEWRNGRGHTPSVTAKEREISTTSCTLPFQVPFRCVLGRSRGRLLTASCFPCVHPGRRLIIIGQAINAKPRARLGIESTMEAARSHMQWAPAPWHIAEHDRCWGATNCICPRSQTAGGLVLGSDRLWNGGRKGVFWSEGGSTRPRIAGSVWRKQVRSRRGISTGTLADVEAAPFPATRGPMGPLVPGTMHVRPPCLHYCVRRPDRANAKGPPNGLAGWIRSPRGRTPR